jgi:hypothetical protein
MGETVKFSIAGSDNEFPLRGGRRTDHLIGQFERLQQFSVVEIQYIEVSIRRSGVNS